MTETIRSKVENADRTVTIMASQEFIDASYEWGPPVRMRIRKIYDDADATHPVKHEMYFQPLHFLDLVETQKEVHDWAERNFGIRDWRQPFMGLVEELGELSHALLKQMQGIRGSSEEHEEAAKDSVGDFMVYLLDFCGAKQWILEDILRETWGKVKMRDWKRNALNGEVAQSTE